MSSGFSWRLILLRLPEAAFSGAPPLHTEPSIKRFEILACAANNRLREALLFIASVIVERWDAAEQEPEGVDALSHDADRPLIARAAEGRVRVADRLPRQRRPRPDTTHAAVALQRAHGAWVEFVVD